MKQVLRNVGGWLLAVLFWLWAIVPKAIDWIGRATLPDDWRSLMNEKLPAALAWLFSTPWYVPALLAVMLTLWMMWINWPSANNGTQGSSRDSSEKDSSDEGECPLTEEGYFYATKDHNGVEIMRYSPPAHTKKEYNEKPADKKIDFLKYYEESIDRFIDDFNAYSDAMISLYSRLDSYGFERTMIGDYVKTINDNLGRLRDTSAKIFGDKFMNDQDFDPAEGFLWFDYNKHATPVEHAIALFRRNQENYKNRFKRAADKEKARIKAEKKRVFAG